jgi:hypothetical protein
MEAEMRERYGWAASLWAVNASLDRLRSSSLGPCTINERVQ